MAAVEIRRVRADEGPLLRAIRLRALAESAHAFAATLEEERALDEAEWAARAAEGAAGADTIVIVAIADGGTGVGMAGGRIREEPGVIGLWGMWVDPAVRGERIGARLVDRVDEWARQLGAHTFRLGVMDDAPEAAAFYERVGFIRQDEARRLSRDPSRTYHQMIRTL